MEKRITLTQNRTNDYSAVTAQKGFVRTGEDMTVAVISPEISQEIRRIRESRKTPKEQKALERAKVRDNLAERMKDVAVWQFENILSLTCAWVTFVDCKGMGCRMMREEGVRFSAVRRRHEVGFYGETPFDVVTLKLRLIDLKKFSVAMRKLRRLAIEGGFEGYPELCAAVINKDN